MMCSVRKRSPLQVTVLTPLVMFPPLAIFAVAWVISGRVLVGIIAIGVYALLLPLFTHALPALWRRR